MFAGRCLLSPGGVVEILNYRPVFALSRKHVGDTELQAGVCSHKGACWRYGIASAGRAFPDKLLLSNHRPGRSFRKSSDALFRFIGSVLLPVHEHAAQHNACPAVRLDCGQPAASRASRTTAGWLDKRASASPATGPRPARAHPGVSIVLPSCIIILRTACRNKRQPDSP